LPVLCPERIRKIPKSFAWIDHRLRSGGFLQRMTPDDAALYLFLSLAADARGCSCWRLDRIEREVLCADTSSLREALEGLVRLDLLAWRPWFKGARDGSYQVLSLPPPAPQPPPGSDAVRLGDLLSTLGLQGS
jgi:hypothetical protein